MKIPKALFGLNGVLLSTFYIILIFNFTMAFYGYYCFGANVQNVITNDLPNDLLYTAIKVLYSVMLLASFPLQMLPVVEIAYFDGLARFLPKKGHSTLPHVGYELAFRTFLAFAISIVPIAIPSVDVLIEFFGATLGTTFAIVLPNLIQVLVRNAENDWGWAKWRLVLHLFILIFSFLLIGAGAYISGSHMVDTFKGH